MSEKNTILYPVNPDAPRVIARQATMVYMPVANATTLGGVKPTSHFVVSADGTIRIADTYINSTIEQAIANVETSISDWATDRFVNRYTAQRIAGVKSFQQNTVFEKSIMVSEQVSVDMTTYSHDKIFFEDRHELAFPEKSGTIAVTTDISDYAFSKQEVQGFLATYYTRAEADQLHEELRQEYLTIEAKLVNVYTKNEVDTKFTNYYSKALVDQKLQGYVSRETLDNYYNKAQVDEEIRKAVAQSGALQKYIVDELPETGEDNAIYLVRKEGSEGDIYNEYLWIDGKWEFIGTTQTDLADYYTKTQVNNLLSGKLDVVNGVANVNTLVAQEVQTGRIRASVLAIGGEYDLLKIYTTEDNKVSLTVDEADMEISGPNALNLSFRYYKLGGVLGTQNQVPMADSAGHVNWATVYTKNEVDTLGNNLATQMQQYCDNAIKNAIDGLTKAEDISV